MFILLEDMSKHQQSYKRRQNKVPLNILSTRRSSRRSNYKITKSVLNFCLAETTTTSDVPSASWENNVPCHEGYEEDGAMISNTTVNAHTKRKQNLAARWDALRNSAYRVMVQNVALQHHQKCFKCGSDDSNVRCELCGPLYMCHSCCIAHHSQMNYHHCPEIWQVCS